MDSFDLVLVFVVGILVCFHVEKTYACTESFTTSRSGVIRSPNYPSNYDNRLDCTWTIHLPNKGRIVLNFYDFEIENDDPCDDYLEITESESGQRLLEKSCGTSMKGKTLVSSSDMISVVFSSDWRSTEKGFNIIWDACGGTFDDPTFPVTSPKPKFYHEQTNCIFQLLLQENMSAIEVDLSRTNVSSYPGHCLIQVFDYDYQRLGEICSDTYPRIYVGNKNEIIIDFKLIYQSSVVLNASFSKYECSSIVTDRSGVLKSLDYPTPFGRDSICDYTFNFTIAADQLLEISFNDLDVSCNKPDVLQFYQYDPSNNVSVVEVCKDNKTDILYMENKMSMRFISEYDYVSARFSMNYSLLECKETMTDTSGLLQSPDYPRPFAIGWICDYSVNVTLQRTQMIEIKFNDLNINCNGADVLQIYQYDSSDNVSVVEVCRDNKTDILLMRNRVSMRFISVRDDFSASFSMNYSIVDEPLETIIDAVRADNQGNNISVLVIIGTAIGAILGIVGVAVLIAVTTYRRKRERAQTKSENIDTDVIYANTLEERIQFQREEQDPLSQFKSDTQDASKQSTIEQQMNLRSLATVSRQTNSVEADNIYAETNDGDYDVLHKARERRVPEKGDNLYDVSVKEDDQYDTTRQHKSTEFDSDDEMYDKARQFHVNDDLYDKAGIS